MPEYTYRRLTAADADVALYREMMRVFGEAFGEPSTYLERPPSDAYVRTLLQKPHVVMLAALAGEVVVGGIGAYVLEKFEQERSEVYLYDLAVDERHRRKGVASGLIHALVDVARSYGAYVVFVQADLVDEPAIKLYESLGSREEVLHFDITVDGGP
jgi:aminoglycoside 3-N-acetyltransferase I